VLNTLDSSGLEGLECQLAAGISNYLNPSLDSWIREEAWMNFTQALHLQYPKNLDIAALYAIASLGTAANAPNYISLTKANEITIKTRVMLESVVELSGGASHPGILHSLTHAYDSMDPGVASRGIIYGEQLAYRFNYSAHAVHMVSHLYLATSQWSKVKEINEKAYLASTLFCTEKGGSSTDILKCDMDDKYHAFEWTHYALLQQEPCQLELKESWGKVEEMERIWKQEQNNVDYENWMFRMYARQTFKDLECVNQSHGNLSCFKGIF